MVQHLLGCPPGSPMPKSYKSFTFQYGRYLGNYYIKHVLRLDISPLCNLCITRQNDNYLHLLSCCKNKHINNFCTNQHNKAVHALAQTLLAYLMKRCYTIINAIKLNNHTPDNTIPSWLLSCIYFLPNCTCSARATT